MKKVLTLLAFLALAGTAHAQEAVSIANEGTTGTTVGKLAKLTGAPSTAIITGTSDTDGIIGIVVAQDATATTGNAKIAVLGIANCTFDGSGVTAGHYVINSTVTAGDCGDGGASRPTTSLVIGQATQTVASGTAAVNLSLGFKGSGSGGSPGGSANDIQYNVGGSTFGGITVANNQLLLGQTSAHPISSSVSSVIDVIGSTRGSILERGASGWVIITPGTSGTALVSNGTGADPTYQAVGGSGCTVSGAAGAVFNNGSSACITNTDMTFATGTLSLGINTAELGALKMFGNTSGNLTIEPPAAAGTNIVVTMSPHTGKGVVATGTLNSGNCVQLSGTDGQIVDSGSTNCGGGGGSSAPATPQGRLTLTTGKPVMASDVTAATTVYYDSYVGNQVPVWNGSAMTGLTIGSDEISMGLSATNHPASGFFSVFAVSNSGTLALCTVAWTNGTTPGSAATSLKNGVWTITSQPTHCFGGVAGATDLASAIGAANEATELGCMATTSTNGQTAMQFAASGAGGGNAWRGIMNNYNRVSQGTSNADTTASWTIGGVADTWGTFHSASSSGTNNRINWFDCHGQIPVRAAMQVENEVAANSFDFYGVCLNSTSCTPTARAVNGTPTTGDQPWITAYGTYDLAPTLGFNFVQAMETFHTNAGTDLGSSAPTGDQLTAFLAY